ncbi:MAG: S41 family peptidase, partial [Eubacterium sp.]|nr:S41 family peptidase [Eubacterium sp.]
ETGLRDKETCLTDTGNGVPMGNQPARKRKKKKRGIPLFPALLLGLILFGAGTLFGSVALGKALGKASGLDSNHILEKLSGIQALVDSYYLDEYKPEDMEKGIYTGFVSGLDDPYSTYYSEEEYRQLMEEDSGEYRGIGVTVTKNTQNNYTEIMSVNKGDPAYNAGIKIGDYILEVNGKDTSAMTLTEVVTEIKTSEDPVILKMYRSGEEFEVSVVKSTISINSVSYEMKENKIGYLSVSQFIDNTDEQFDKAISDLESQGMKGLIIDLRDNGGGLLDSCVNMVSRIIPQGDLVVYTQYKDGERQDYNSNSEAVLTVPIVILTNGNTASASEILTGCLKDYGLATVLGTTTYGKGIVQSIIPLGDGSAVKLTVSAYYTPKGNNIHKKGIEPDVEMKMTDEEWKKAVEDPSTDRQIQRACQILTGSGN